MSVAIRFKMLEGCDDLAPAKAHSDDAAYDLRSRIDLTIDPGKVALVPTGLTLELPVGYEAQVRPRSGLAIKKGISVLNTPGTIDADYRGEICVILVNLSDTDFVVEDGERICQMVVKEYVKVEWEEAEELSDTERGAGGFGHTGVK